jgi:hypothetical protein
MVDGTVVQGGTTSQVSVTEAGAGSITSMPRTMGMRDPTGESVCKRYEKAKTLWDRWRPLWQDIYDLCLPQRRGFQITTEGRRNTLQIFDETAVTGVQEFASRVATTMMPPYMRWVDLRCGSGVPPDQREQNDQKLAAVTETLFEIINKSNFHTMAVEAVTEMAMSTGVMIIEDDFFKGIRCQAVPLTRVVLDAGPKGEVDFWSRERKIRLGTLLVDYPGAQVPYDMVNDLRVNPDRELTVIEATWRVWEIEYAEVYHWALVWKDQAVTLDQRVFSGLGSNPWVTFTWNKDPYETYGRGPLVNAIGAIKTCNLTVQLTLENAEMAIVGMWQYDEDGVIDVDNIQFTPNSMIAKDAQSKGLEQLKAPGDFNVVNLVLSDMRENIKRALYVGQFAPLGKTPQSATEVAYRQQDLAERIGSSWGRLNQELVQKVVQRVAFLLRRQGKIRLPDIDGHIIDIVSISPLSKRQNQDDVMSITQFLGQIGQLLGPNTVPIVVDPMETARELGRLQGVPPKLLRSADDQAAAMQQLQQMAQQAAQQGPGAAGGSPAQGPGQPGG